MQSKMEAKICGMYPDRDATSDKILKKLGFRRGTNSKGRHTEHAGIYDPHKTEAASLIKGSAHTPEKEVTEKSISLKSGLKDQLVNAYMKGRK